MLSAECQLLIANCHLLVLPCHPVIVHPLSGEASQIRDPATSRPLGDVFLPTFSRHQQVFAFGDLSQLIARNTLVAIKLQAVFSFTWQAKDRKGKRAVV